MLVGVTAKFNPFCSKDTSASLKDLEDKLITHLDLEAIHIRLHPDNINGDNGIEIPEAWMPTIKQHSSRSVPRRTAEGTISSLNDEDRNPPTNNSLREDRNAPINTNQGATYTVTQSVDTIA